MSEAAPAAARPMLSSAASAGFGALAARARLEIDDAHFLDEAVMPRRHSDELGLLAVAIRAAGEALQQPGPHGVERIDPADVEGDVRSACDLRRDAVDQALQHVGMGSRPRPPGDEGEPAGGHRAVEHGYRGVIGDVVAMCAKAHSAVPGSTQPASGTRPTAPMPAALLHAQNIGDDVAKIIVGNDDVRHGAV